VIARGGPRGYGWRIKSLLLTTVVLGTALAAPLTQAGAGPAARSADAGPIEATTNVLPEDRTIQVSGRVVLSRPCRRSRDLNVTHLRGGRKVSDGTFHPTNRRGHFEGELPFDYTSEGHEGDVPQAGGRITYTLKAPRTRPQRDRFHAYHCKRLKDSMVVDVPPDPFAEGP
jgi:hypothetical protein